MKRGMEKGKAQNVYHFSTSQTAMAGQIKREPRYTDWQTGTNLRADQHFPDNAKWNSA